MKGQIYETRPLESWAKAKELRAKWEKMAEREDLIVGQGNFYICDMEVAFPKIKIIEDNPVGSMIQARNSAFARKCRLASEIRGWGREICGYQGNCWGAQFLGYLADGTKFPKRRFVVPMTDPCDQHTKRGQQVRDFDPTVPMWNCDYMMYYGPRDPEREDAFIEHQNYCYLRVLNDIERIFGQKFDDEMFIEQVKCFNELNQICADVFRAMTHVPAPLTVKDIYSFYTIGGLTKVDPEETMNLWRMFRDEVWWRVENNIAGLGTERYRWMEAHPPSWHFLKYYRYMEKYGAVCIGSQYTNGMAGEQFEKKPDGTIGLRDRMFYPPDMPIKTREDAMRFAFGPDARVPPEMKQDEYIRPDSLCEFARIYKCDGAILPIWRHGVGCTMTRKEQGRGLTAMGVNVLHYEGSQPGDRTDLDEKHFLDQLDAWMESQGLEKLED